MQRGTRVVIPAKIERERNNARSEDLVPRFSRREGVPEGKVDAIF
jgi:hypothetical protein